VCNAQSLCVPGASREGQTIGPRRCDPKSEMGPTATGSSQQQVWPCPPCPESGSNLKAMAVASPFNSNAGLPAVELTYKCRNCLGSKICRHSPGTPGTCFSGPPDTIRTCDPCLSGPAATQPAPTGPLPRPGQSAWAMHRRPQRRVRSSNSRSHYAL
jgi:hypothetical protein